jgi:hypothetical protein
MEGADMTITTEEAELHRHQIEEVRLLSLAAERDALKAAINEALTAEQVNLITRLRNTPNWMREEFGSWKSVMRSYDRAPFEAADALEFQSANIVSLRAKNARLREVLAKTTKILVAAFNRIHGLPRTTDTELSTEIEKCLGEIRRVREETQ